MIWFNLKNGNEIAGWQESAKATEVPAGSVLTDDAGRTLYQTLKGQSLDDGRDGTVLWNSTLSLPELPVDDRIVVNLSADKTHVELNSTLTLAFTLPNNPNLNNTFYRKFYGRWLKLDFVNGVATKILTMTENGKFRIASNEQYKITSPVEFIVYE